MTENERRQLTEDETQAAAAQVIFTTMKMLVDRGVSVQRAMRMTVQNILEAEFGNQPWKELGVDMRTVYRWRQEGRKELAEAREIEETPPAEFLEMWQRLYKYKDLF